MSAETIFSLPQTGIREGAHDGLDVFPDRIVIQQRTAGAGPITLPASEITEVRAQGNWSFDGRGYRLHLRVGSKKYVIRRLKKEEAHGAAEAVSGILS